MSLSGCSALLLPAAADASPVPAVAAAAAAAAFGRRPAAPIRHRSLGSWGGGQTADVHDPRRDATCPLSVLLDIFLSPAQELEVAVSLRLFTSRAEELAPRLRPLLGELPAALAAAAAAAADLASVHRPAAAAAAAAAAAHQRAAEAQVQQRVCTVQPGSSYSQKIMSSGGSNAVNLSI